MKSIRNVVVYILVALMLIGTALPVHAEELVLGEETIVEEITSESTEEGETESETELETESESETETETESETETETETETESESESEQETESETEAEVDSLSLDGDTGVVTLTAETIKAYMHGNGKYTLPTGSYKLGGPLNLSGSIQIQPGQDVTLDLAGCTLTSSAADAISPAGTFTLTDSSVGQTGKIAFAANQNYSTRTAVNVNATGKFILQSGTIGTGFTFGVRVSGRSATFTMNGGTLNSPLLVNGGEPLYPSTMQANGGTVNAAVTVGGGNKIEGSGMTTFGGTVSNGGTISAGTFSGAVTNGGTISGGQFSSTVTNDRTISGGTFSGVVTNSSKGAISSGTFSRDVTNNGTISGGSFTMNTTTLTNNGTISGGTFVKQVTNNADGKITSGDFQATVTNSGGIVTGGSFAFSQNIYKVSYDTDGGGEAPMTQYVANAPATEPEKPVKTGYTFGGWYNGDTKYTFSENEKITSDVTLKAKWSATVYSVTYSGVTETELGTGAVKSYTIETPAFSLPTPNRADYTFLGWTGTDLVGVTQSVTIREATGDREYTAHWRKIDHYTVIYHTAGGTQIDDRYVTAEDKLLPDSEPSREGYTFGGWYYADTLVGEDMPCGDLGLPAESTIILTAAWEPIPYSITYENVDSAEWPVGDDAPPFSYTIVDSVTLPTPSRAGYSFGGWYDNEKFTGKAVKTIDKGETGPKTFYAKWTENNYTVVFESTGGSEVETKTNVKWSDRVLTGVENPTRNGYQFASWTYGSATAVSEYTTYGELAKNGSTESITLWAQWFDVEAPRFDGIADKGRYCSFVRFKVTDNESVSSVTAVLDSPAGSQTLLCDTAGYYHLEAGLGQVTITAKDLANNETSVTITLENGCFGGTATCSTKPVCVCCGAGYGELDPTNHTLEHFIAIAPSEKAEGCIEHWFCSGCKKYFSDAEGKNEIDKADTVIAKLPASTAANGGGTATGAHAPKTGDNSLTALWLALAAASALGLGYLTARKRKN